jgi:hypothetical protein
MLCSIGKICIACFLAEGKKHLIKNILHLIRLDTWRQGDQMSLWKITQIVTQPIFY